MYEKTFQIEFVGNYYKLFCFDQQIFKRHFCNL